MRPSSTPLALLALPLLAHAVTLADFKSGDIRNNDKLSDACNAVYVQNIDGCGEADFTAPPCSKSCVTGLVGMIGPVYAACNNDGLKGPSILFNFLQGSGPESLCQNDASVSSAASAGYAALETSTQRQSSSAAGYGSATSSPQSTAASSTSTPATTSSAAAATSPTSSSSSSASSVTDVSATSSAVSTSLMTTSTATSLVVDTSSSPSVQSTASSTSSSQGSSQTSNDGSGGGSPFDTVNNGSSAASTFTSSTLALVLAAAGAMLALR